MTNDFKFKTPQANYLYNRLIQIAEELKVRVNERNLEVEHYIDRIYAENSTMSRYQEMVGYAFSTAMTVELSIIESFASVSSILGDD